MQQQQQREAAQLLARSWMAGRHIGDLPAPCRPLSRRDAYAVQALWPDAVGQAVAGWKIAATSQAGQQHIAVSGPLAGPVFAHRVHPDGAEVSLAANRMRVAECEIVFTLGRALAPRAQRYGRDEVLGDPVEALVWLVNELAAAGQSLAPGQFVTTGACVPPIPVLPGQKVQADFGWIGRIRASFA